EALEAIQNLVQEGYADPAGTPQQFLNERTAMVFVGHWMYAPYKEKFGDDLGLTYYPGMKKNVTGSGSYTWGVSEQTDNPEAAAEVLKWIVNPESILIMTKGEDMDGQKIADGNSAPPARKSVYEHFPEYTKYPLDIFTTQLEEGVAHARPTTPVYGTLTNEFRKAINDIVQGANVQKKLDNAAKKVDEILEERDYYGLK
ncbi:extracellular solute-binding protein, partial [Candidatus Bipolaricaulota bacterium]|nr:extracellular solute-binding protein [Candidatus Bipolaricaulota bacterium]